MSKAVIRLLTMVVLGLVALLLLRGVDISLTFWQWVGIVLMVEVAEYFAALVLGFIALGRAELIKD